MGGRATEAEGKGGNDKALGRESEGIEGWEETWESGAEGNVAERGLAKGSVAKGSMVESSVAEANVGEASVDVFVVAAAVVAVSAVAVAAFAASDSVLKVGNGRTRGRATRAAG